MKRGFYESIATLIGTTIGAGILALPYTVSKSGIPLSMLAIIIIAVLTLIVNLNYAKVIAKKKQAHQITGYTRMYLGKKAEWFMIAVNTLFIYGAMTAYLSGISGILSDYIPIDPRIIGFFAMIIIMSVIYLGLTVFEKSELLFGAIVVGLFIIIAFAGFFAGRAPAMEITAPNWPLFGILIFSFMGLHALPEMWEENPNKKEFLKAIKISSLVITLIYIVFIMGVLFLAGQEIEEVATTGLAKISPILGLIANILALITIFTTYLSLAFCLKDMWTLDYKTKEWLAVILACIPPFIPFAMNLAGFDKILSITGMVFGGIINIVVVAIIIKARKIGIKS